MRFDSECDCSPPTILFGLLLCPWTWDDFGGTQHTPADCCSAASGKFGVLEEDDHMSFYSAILLLIVTLSKLFKHIYG